MFRGRKLVIATKHHKEQVIAPLLEAALGVSCIVPQNLDTDLLGTFTGEIERKDDPIATAKKKARLAMTNTGCDLAVANEGSFGPHPISIFLNADDEIMVLIDKKYKLEICYREISLKTNFNGREILDEEELISFAHKIHFPSHALILRSAKNRNDVLFKGITDWQALRSKFRLLFDQFGSAYAETDMRAMYNPTRMAVIEQATKKLVEKINSACPACGTPGFGVTAANSGLPCSLCGQPTRSTLNHVYTCQSCSFSKAVYYPYSIQTEDPVYCDYCNP